MAAEERYTIPGSEREIDPTHRRVGEPDGDQQIEVTAYLRPRTRLGWVDAEAAKPPPEQRRMTREQLAAAHGARDEDVAAVRAFASEYGLELAGVDGARRAVGLRGTVRSVAGAFGVEDLGIYEDPAGRRYRGRHGALTVPAGLADVVTGVFGIDDRPQAATRLRQSEAPSTSYTPLQVAAAYDFPSGVTGAGQTIGIIELGGGFSQSDLDTYFTGLGLSTPTVTAVSVDGAANAPGVDSDTDGEVMLDIEVAGAVANGVALAVYFAPNTDQGFLDAVSQAVHDTANRPTVLSISWGQNEEAWTAQARAQMEQSFTDAAALGVTVTVAAGDNGSTDGVDDGSQHVDFPASAPHALACGGTSLQASGAQIISETVWNDASGATGGGVSIEFALPAYQANASVPANVDTGAAGRGVPDVAGDADPDTGYSVRVDGSDLTVGGTSAVAPLWAGLIALFGDALGSPVGFAQPRIYPLVGTAAFHDITSGDNGAYSAGRGWDACTGLGSPAGAALLAALKG